MVIRKVEWLGSLGHFGPVLLLCMENLNTWINFIRLQHGQRLGCNVVVVIDKALLLRTRHLVLDSELQFGPSSLLRALPLRSTEKTFKTKRNGASARIKICVLNQIPIHHVRLTSVEGFLERAE